MANISAIKLPNGTTYAINDLTKVLKAGDTMTGQLITEAGIKSLSHIILEKPEDVSWSSSGGGSEPSIQMVGASNKIFKFKFSTSGQNVDVGWDWAAGDGSGAAFRGAAAGGNFIIYARNSTSVEKALQGTVAGVLTWNGRRVVTSTNSTAVGSTSLPIYIDSSGYAQPVTSLDAASLSGTISSAVTATTQASTDNSTKIATTAYVTTAIANLPEPMIFKGSVGTNGTVTTLPTAAAGNEGWTYKVITALSSPAAKVGDTVISNGSSWVVIPSGDEPGGTVTSVTLKGGTGISVDSESAITTSGTRTISVKLGYTTSGNNRAVQADSNGNLYVVQKDDNTNTTYTLTNALASHKFTWTLTPSSGSATTTTAELAAGNNISLTDDATNKKITIAATDTTYTAGTGLRLSGTQFINTKIPFVAGTQTAATGSWTGVCNDITGLYDGLTIAYWLPYAGSGNATLNLTINGTATGAKNCYYGGTSRLTTHYGAGNIIYLTYRSAGSINGTNYEGWWAQSQYDSNTVDRLRDSYFRPYAGEAVYRYKFVMQGADNRMYPITVTNQENTTQVAKVPTQVGLRPGRIWYYNTTATVAAGGLFAAYTLDEAFQTTAGAYNFNTSAAAYRMIYLRGTYNKTTDLFTLYKDNSSPCTSYYTYVPTNTANITLSSYFTSGYYYILLGGTYSSADYISLFPYNPLYYFDGTNLIPAETKVATDIKPTATQNATTGISIAAHGTGTVIGVQSSTTTASKVTVGSHSTDYGVKSAGSASTWTFEEKTIPNVTAAGSGSASLTFAMDTTDTKKLKITFSHTHTAPTIGTAIKVQSKSGGANGTAPTLGSKVPTVSASDVTVPIKNASASTFVTGTTHTITDNGHTHSI